MRNILSLNKLTGSILFILLTFLTLSSSFAQVQENANKIRPRDRYVPRAYNAVMQADLARTKGPKPGTVINGYYPEWATYDNFNVKNLVTSHTARKLTHLSYAFGAVTNNQCALTDIYADIQQVFTADTSVNGRNDSAAPMALHGNFQQLLELKRQYPKLKMILSIQTSAASFSEAAQPENREAFVSSCVNMFIKGNFDPSVKPLPGLFDGIDIDWEYPVASDAQNLVALLKEFRRQFAAVRPGLILTMTGPAGSWAYDPIPLAAAAKQLTFINLMTYDYNGPWQNSTGPVAPMTESPLDPVPDDYTIERTLQGYFAAGVPASKIVLGIPFYGYGWEDVPNVNEGQFQPGTPVDQGGDAYSYIVTLMPTYKQYRDPKTDVVWLFNGNEYWTYDDPETIHVKMDYALKNKLLGAMIWSLDNDMPDGQLMNAVYDGLADGWQK
ncbi:MAG TPA: glycosyl hydrolase family 18 protein [Acidobacteriaceae bacterium]|jgi:chitinase|nr:glycosyl hydrolase family 18 protein [Acidobacteriaceae bacterium]